MKVKLNNVRLAFAKLFEPKAVGQGKDLYYSAAFPIEPGSDNHKLLESTIEQAAREKWGAKGPGIIQTLRDNGDAAYQLKPLKDRDGQVYGGFEGMYSLNASLNAKRGKPLVLDKYPDPVNPKTNERTGRLEPRVILDPAEGKPYAGCYVNATVDIWCQDNSNGRRLNCQLMVVQYWGDGDAFGGGARPSADDFDEIADGADAGALA